MLIYILPIFYLYWFQPDKFTGDLKSVKDKKNGDVFALMYGPWLNFLSDHHHMSLNVGRILCFIGIIICLIGMIIAVRGPY